VRTEVGSVLVQNDVCNGCGYCVVSCPFGVIDRRPEPLHDAGGAFKCTFCYDRQKSGLVPACAKVCRPNRSCLADWMICARVERSACSSCNKVVTMTRNFYDPMETSVRGIHAFFLILGEPEAYGLPPKPQVSNDLPEVRVDVGVRDGDRINHRDARGIRIFFVMKDRRARAAMSGERARLACRFGASPETSPLTEERRAGRPTQHARARALPGKSHDERTAIGKTTRRAARASVGKGRRHG